MASNLRLPMAVPLNISQSTLGSVQSRSFSQSSQQWAGGRAVNFRPPSVAQPSFKTRTKDMKPSDLPNDIGLLPGTFVRPLWRDMPSIFQQPRERLHMEWTWMKSVFSNYTRSVMSCTKQEHVLINEQSSPILQARKRPPTSPQAAPKLRWQTAGNHVHSLRRVSFCRYTSIFSTSR